MKKTGAKALFAAAALLAFADGGFACENCPDDEPAAASGDGRRRVLMAVNKSPGEAVALDVSALNPVGTDFLPATILSGDSLYAYNDVGSENRVVPQKVRLAVADGKTTLPPHSVAAIVLADNP